MVLFSYTKIPLFQRILYQGIKKVVSTTTEKKYKKFKKPIDKTTKRGIMIVGLKVYQTNSHNLYLGEWCYLQDLPPDNESV